MARARGRLAREASRARIVAAATELVRDRAYAELSVEAVMREADLGRTIFYRHFSDLADLIGQAGREAIEELYAAEEALADVGAPHERLAEVIDAAVATFVAHGPLLRAIAEAAAADAGLAAGLREIRDRFDRLAASVLASVPGLQGDPMQVAHALNLMNEAYLLDAYGRSARMSPDLARATLTAIWSAVLR